MSIITSNPAPSAPGFGMNPDPPGGNAHPVDEAGLAVLAQLPAPAMVFQGPRVAFANRHAADLFNRENSDDLVGMAGPDLMRLASGEPDFDTMTDAAASQFGQNPIAVTCRRSNGANLETRATFGPLQWRGNAACIVCFWPRDDASGDPPSLESADELTYDITGAARWEWWVTMGSFHVSSEFKSHLNYRKENFPTDFMAWTKIIHPDDRALNERRLIDHLEGRDPVYQADIRVMEKNGEPRWVRLCGKAIWNGGSIERLIGVISDVTEQKQREAEHADAVGRALDT